MSITLKDLPTLLKLLEQHPEWREALRALLLSEDLLRMPQELEAFRAEVYRRFAELAEALTRSVEMEIRQTQAQAHTEEALARLAEAQGRAEEHLARLEEVVAQLTERVVRLEEAMAQLAERVGRLEEVVAQLTERAVRLEEAMAQLAEQVVRLEEGQQRLEARLTRMEERLIRRLNAFGARWGSRSERAWREGMRAVLEAAGFEVERWVAFDAQGEVFDYPSDVELDVVIQDGRTLIVELRTSVSRDALPTMERKVKFYERQTGRKAHRRILMTPWYEPGVEEMARQLGWEIYGEPEEIEAEG
ncbi:MAG: DUF3782 domain-containing protein [Thermoflexus sp.]|uniref:PD-(D/E)XK nuclease family protein n=1 Tax=Thermoflexus sp. TaxID=1969742 RepID=UPI0025D615B4|nr:DUF3782 domain-containing protein [Thermoflexus sp.]MCS6964884.1 DUF3782 domain-containing protein [Thermoflexus sp.]MCS7351672.1 DUF3782 domain-containing protein [Thermoflexus sp.]MDW8181130.1 DUF3782 domain-containing protein [Anaerolineae bacterium]MDW8184356.1 DUF3782 domain-containing protein [Anaerolineae bacterium]